MEHVLTGLMLIVQLSLLISVQLLLGKAHENALQLLALHYLQYDLYLCAFFTIHLQDSVSLHTTLSKR